MRLLASIIGVLTFLCAMVVGGLLVSQLLTLYVTPVVYLYLESARGTLLPYLRREWTTLRHLSPRRAH